MTIFLLDTMVVSELTKSRRNRNVERWLASLPVEDARISAITFGEIERGIEQLPDGPKREKLRHWSEVVLPREFSGRIVDFDIRSARTWGVMEARARRTMPARDAMIAATALAHGLVVATRNVRDFAQMAVPTFDPWSA